MVSKHWKRQTLSAFIFVNTVQYPRTLGNNIHHSNKQEPQSFFHMDTNPVTAHTLVHSVNKTHVLVVTVELIWLLFFQLCSSSRKISQVHKSTDKVTLLFCLMCTIQSGHVPFLAAIFSQWQCICIVEHTCCSNVANSKLGRQTNRCERVINIANLTLGVKHSIGHRTTFSPNLHSIEEETLECLPILQH